ncbi:MAG: sigma 54-interacting transcriptional regulator [Thermodesulfobacteriota bacterium]
MKPMETELFALLDQLPCGVILVNSSAEVSFLNEAAKQLYSLDGYVTGRPVADILPALSEAVNQVLTIRNPYHAEEFLCNHRSLELKIIPIGPDPTGVAILSNDRTELRRTREELEFHKSMKRWLDAVIDSCYDGLWICDHEGNVLRINKASERISGVQAQEVVGKNMRDLIQEGLYDRSVTFEVLEKKTAVTLIQKVKGSKRALVTGIPVFDERGDIQFVVTTNRDLTELDQLRAQLEETRALAQICLSQLSEVEMRGADLSTVIYRSGEMRRVLEMALRMAQVQSTVLLLGESGVGKGMIAKVIHKNSPRKEGPLIRVDCTGIPDSLVESELFGYERGAFTGARTEGKPGLLELADGGTVFLDEIGELPVGSQSKLLHFLEDHEICRVGGTTPRRIDVRVIAATNRNLEQLVQSRQFREDLYYRLNIVPISIPPLRERKEDIPCLAFHCLMELNKSYGTHKTLAPNAIDAICRYSFPGNVRELYNLVERLTVATDKDQISQEDLPKNVKEFVLQTPHGTPSSFRKNVEIYEKALIENALKRNGSIRKTAQALQVNHATILRKMKKYKISPYGAFINH